jgi:hypothetical protein
MNRSAFSAAFLALVLGSSGPRVAAAPQPPKPLATSVAILQVDGLSPALLSTWLKAQYGNALRRLFGVLLYERGAEHADATLGPASALFAPSAVTVLPSLPDTASATILTGQPPRLHGVLGSGSGLATGADTLHTVVGAKRGPTASAGMPFSDGAAFVAAGSDDGSRTSSLVQWLAQQEQRPALVTVRFDSLATALDSESWASAEDALAAIDGHLDQILFGDGALYSHATLVVLTAGHGAARLGPTDVQQVMNADGQSVGAEGALVVTPAGAWSRERLLGAVRDFLVVTRTGDRVQIADDKLPGFRGVTAYERSRYPLLESRVLDALKPGESLLLDRRDQQVHGWFGKPAMKPGRRARGSVSQAESLVPLVLAGEPLKGRAYTVDSPATLGHIRPTVLAALGISAAGGADTAAPLLKIAPTSGDPRLQPARGSLARLLEVCRHAVAANTNVARDCKPLLSRTHDRSVAAEVTIALLVDAVRSGRQPADSIAVDRALAITAWLSPDGRWPDDDIGLRSRWPQDRARCDARDGLAVAAISASAPVGATFSDAVKTVWSDPTLSEGRPAAVVTWCAVPVPSGDAVLSREEWAGLIARFSGAAVLAWSADDDKASPFHVTVAVPALSTWLGPPIIHAPVRDAAVFASYIHFWQAFDAFDRGLHPRAGRHLSQATALSGVAEAWRQAVAEPPAAGGDSASPGANTAKKGDAATSNAASKALPLEERWAAAISGVVGAVELTSSEGMSLDMMQTFGFGRLLPFSAPGKPAEWSGDRRTFLESLQDKPDTTFLERVGNSGLSAYVRIGRLAEVRHDPASFRRETNAILDLLRSRSSAWMRLDGLERLYTAIEQYQPQKAGDMMTALDDLFFESLRQAIADDRQPGYAERNVDRLSKLIPHVDRVPDECRKITDQVAALPGDSALTTFIRATVVEDDVQPLGLVAFALNAQNVTELATLFLEWRPETRAKPAGQDLIADRAFHFMTSLAALVADNPKGALALLADAELEGSNKDLLEQRLAALKQNTKQDLRLLAPWLRVATRVTQGMMWASSTPSDPARAKAAIAEGADMLRQLIDATVIRTAGNAPATGVDGLTAALEVLAHNWIDGGRPSEDLWKSAAAVDVRLTSGPHARMMRWLALVEVVLKDSLWLNDSKEGRQAALHNATLRSATDKLNAVVNQWFPLVEAKSQKHVLRLMLAAQGLVRHIPPAASDADLLEALRHPGPGLREELENLRNAVNREFPEAERRRRVLYADDFDGVIPDLFVGAIEIFRRGLDMKSQNVTDALLSAFGSRVDGWLSQLRERKASKTAALLAYARAALVSGKKEAERNAALLQAAAAQLSGTDAEERRCMWLVFSAAALMNADGDRARARGALDSTAKACPNVASELELGHARLAAEAGDVAAAYAALDRYAAGAASWFSDYSITYGYTLPNIMVRYSATHEVTSVMLDPAHHPGGRGNLTFGMFAASAPEFAPTKGLQVDWRPRGSASSARQLSSLLRAWIAFGADDDAIAGRALGELLGRHVVDGAFYESNIGQQTSSNYVWGVPPRGPVDDVLLSLWVGTVAELRGHRRLAAELLRRVQESSEREALEQQSDERWFVLRCDAADEVQEDSPALVRWAECVPTALQWLTDAGPIQRVAKLRARKLAGLEVPVHEWQSAIAEASTRFPRMVPANTPDTAGAPGFACDAAFAQNTDDAGSSPEALRVARQCGAAPVLIPALLAAPVTSADDALAVLNEILAMTVALRRNGMGLPPDTETEQIAVIRFAERLMADPARLRHPGASAKLRVAANRADDIGWQATALALESLAVLGALDQSSAIEELERVFVRHLEAGFGGTPHAVLLRQLLYASDTPEDRAEHVRRFFASRS